MDDWTPVTWRANAWVRQDGELTLTVREVFPHSAQGMARYRYRIMRNMVSVASSAPGGYATPNDAMEAADAAAKSIHN
jgi:hypothetical protein